MRDWVKKLSDDDLSIINASLDAYLDELSDAILIELTGRIRADIKLEVLVRKPLKYSTPTQKGSP